MENQYQTKFKPLLPPPVLGRREIDTLNLFWRAKQPQLSASDIHCMFIEQAKEYDHVVSINTIQSTTERLWRKKLLNRYKQGKAYIYTCAYSRQELIGSLISEISDALGAEGDSAIISGILIFLKSRNKDSKLNAFMAQEHGGQECIKRNDKSR
jgi:predicted transcriptional regulator